MQDSNSRQFGKIQSLTQFQDQMHEIFKVTEEPCLELNSSSVDKKKAFEKWVGKMHSSNNERSESTNDDGSTKSYANMDDLHSYDNSLGSRKNNVCSEDGFIGTNCCENLGADLSPRESMEKSF